MKKRKWPTVKAWVWLSYADSDSKRASFREFGNGRQYQFPVFGSRKEALDWKSDGCGVPGLLARLARVQIRILR